MINRTVCFGQAPSGAQDQIFFTFRQLRVCCCGAPSLTRGRICYVQLVLVLASAVILRSESRGTHNHVLLLRFGTCPTWRARFSCLHTPGIGWPSYTLRYWVPFSSPPTTRTATMEVSELVSTRTRIRSPAGRLNFFWPSPAQSFLTSVSSRSMTKIFVLL
jgi:hypothetical protein